MDQHAQAAIEHAITVAVEQATQHLAAHIEQLQTDLAAAQQAAANASANAQQAMQQAQAAHPFPDVTPIIQQVLQNIPALAAPATTTVTTDASSGFKAPEPPVFTGKREDARTFMRAVQLTFAMSPKRFPAGDERTRIMFTLLYIREGHAGTWANNLATAFLDPARADPYLTFAAFKTAFDEAFGDADRQHRACIEMSLLRMKSGDSVEEYTTAFEALADDTEYNEQALINAYRMGLLPRIHEKVYTENPPTTLKDWKAKARRVDTLWRDLKAFNTVRQDSHSSTPTKPRTYTSTHLPPPPAVTVTATTTSDAMDVDAHRSRKFTGVCYNCGEVGHIASRCPKPSASRPRGRFSGDDVKAAVRAALLESGWEFPKKTVAAEASKDSDFPPPQQ